MTRTAVKGLKWAHYGPHPSFIPRTRYKGSRARGIAFERKIGKLLKADHPIISLGQWIYFEDSLGLGVAQPDILLQNEKCTHIVECKLSYRNDIELKLREVYGTLLRFLHPEYSLHFTQIFHNWRDFKGDTIALDELLEERTPNDYLFCQY